MEKCTYNIIFNIKNNPSKDLLAINKLLVETSCNIQKMADTATQQMDLICSPIDEARTKWLDFSKDIGAYFAVFSENASGIAVLTTLYEKLDKIGAITRMTSIVQQAYNGVISIGQRALYVYQMQVLTAHSAISTTTGATKALNMVIAASPWILAATAAATLAFGIYKICSASDDTSKSQERLNGLMSTMNKEVANERLALDSLFEPLKQAREGTAEWQQAKDDIVAKYGGYLDKMGIEITNADTARIAYNKLSEAILDAARARAMDAATQGAAETYADKESEALTKVRDKLYSGIGSGAGKITAQEAGKAWAQIRLAIRTGSDIPKETDAILEKLQTTWNDSRGFSHQSNPIANTIRRHAQETREAKKLYEKEIANANAVLGGTGNLQSASKVSPDKVTGTNQNQNNLTVIPRVETKLAQGSISDLEAQLAALKEKQQNSPIEKSIIFSVKIAELEKEMAQTKGVIDKANFQAEHPNKPGALNDNPIGGRSFEKPVSSLDLGAENGGLKDMKLEPVDFSMDEPLSSMERWNEAVGFAREQNQALADNMGAVGGAMGSVGSLIGGAAGEWLQWGANAMQAIGQAIPQIVALCGMQQAQATANTATAATGAASSVASIPFVGPFLAIAAVASVLAALASLPKFAYGGLAYGPTFGLFGEYAGAINNPEVVAPLNRLRSLIGPAEGMESGKVQFRIEGRTLVGILEREGNLNRRS